MVGPAQSGLEFACQRRKRRSERRPARDQHIIMAAAKRPFRHKAHDLAQAPAHPVALDRVPHLPRHRKADARRACAIPPAHLEDESAPRHPDASGCSPKVRPAFQPLHEMDQAGMDQ
jgi:hypothetical protein